MPGACRIARLRRARFHGGNPVPPWAPSLGSTSGNGAGEAGSSSRGGPSVAANREPVAAPDEIVFSRDRDLRGRDKDIWIRRLLMGLIAVIPVLALFNLFGQRPSTSKASVSAATLSVYAPTRVRGGLLWEARFHITAHRALKNAILVLDPGWAEGMSINTIEPSPSNEASHNGKLEFTLGHVPANESYILF